MVIFGPPKGCSMMTLRPVRGKVSHDAVARSIRRLERTLGTEGNRYGVGKDVNALEDGGTALVGELDLLVRTAGKNRLDGLRGLAADDRGRCREVVHGGEREERRRRERGRRRRRGERE